MKTISEELGVGFLGVGFDPKHTLDQCPMMPKGRQVGDGCDEKGYDEGDRGDGLMKGRGRCSLLDALAQLH